MLLIHGGLYLGGIETFFLRLAKFRHAEGKRTKILIFSAKNLAKNEIYAEFSKYGEVWFSEDLFKSNCVPFAKTALLSAIDKKVSSAIFDGVDQIHVTNAHYALIADKMCKAVGLNKPITVGFYHYIKNAWGNPNFLPYFEKINRSYLFHYLPKQSLFFFSSDCKGFYEKYVGKPMPEAREFRLGVVSNIKMSSHFNDEVCDGFIHEPSKKIKICSVGRLVEFKTYNLYMLDVVKDLRDKGYNCVYDIYGSGPLKSKIEKKVSEYGLADFVKLKGEIPYSKFDDCVVEYDVFIGSGTAIIQASSVGVISIVAVENDNGEGLSYGYFSQVYAREYNMPGVPLEKVGVRELIQGFINMDLPEKRSLSEKHTIASKNFLISDCCYEFEQSNYIKMPDHRFSYSKFRYEISRVFYFFIAKYIGSFSSWNRRYRDFEAKSREVFR